jgi:hypothetical protein
VRVGRWTKGGCAGEEVWAGYRASVRRRRSARGWRGELEQPWRSGGCGCGERGTARKEVNSHTGEGGAVAGRDECGGRSGERAECGGRWCSREVAIWARRGAHDGPIVHVVGQLTYNTPSSLAKCRQVSQLACVHSGAPRAPHNLCVCTQASQRIGPARRFADGQARYSM